MARQHRQILPFRIPFFRIWYSTTYTIIFIILLCFLAITPGTLIWDSIQNQAWQYVFIIAGVYVLTLIITIFIYSSRLYTNRSVLATIGKSYIPIEEDEIGQSVRRMIVKQLKRSAIVSWEARPRDLAGEVRYREKSGLVKPEDKDATGKVIRVGTLVSVTIRDPPWGNVQHRGWTAPGNVSDDLQSNLQFDTVITELPNLLEARVVSLAAAYPAGMFPETNEPMPDPVLVELLRRQEKMGMREYLLQLSYLQLVHLDGAGGEFLNRYESARFSGRPPSIDEFKSLMTVFGVVMDDMVELNPTIVQEIRRQSAAPNTILSEKRSSDVPRITLDIDTSPLSSNASMVYSAPRQSANDTPTKAAQPYSGALGSAKESASSVLWSGNSDVELFCTPREAADHEPDPATESLDSDAGSIIYHHT